MGRSALPLHQTRSGQSPMSPQHLPHRRILALRVLDECTQQQIADDIGLTRMQVSRLLRRIYAELRTEMTRATS